MNWPISHLYSTFIALRQLGVEDGIQRGMKTYVLQDFPGGAVVKNPPANSGDMGSSPGSGKIPHATEQLSLCTTTTEPAL